MTVPTPPAGPPRRGATPGLTVFKGHGTENDFVLVPDLDGELDLGADLVRALCDRRAGVGADGVLRVVRTAAMGPVTGGPGVDAPSGDGPAEFFMDYRNADGSVAEMCGNGLRVFLRYLIESGLAGPGPVAVGTRGGVRTAWAETDGQITADLGRAGFPDVAPDVYLPGWPAPRRGVSVSMPNPHVVVEMPDAADLAALDLGAAPRVDPGRPDDQNVEFFCRLDPRHIAMRVHERGVGETRSCGTGIAAAALVAMGAVATGAVATGATGASVPPPWRVDVPGGTCLVRVGADGGVRLTGPAVLVGRLELAPGWLAVAAAAA